MSILSTARFGLVLAEVLGAATRNRSGGRPLVVCVATIGDLLLATPLIESLYRESNIPVDVLTTATAAPILRGNPAIGNVYKYDQAIAGYSYITVGGDRLLDISDYGTWYSIRTPPALMWKLIMNKRSCIRFVPNPFYERLSIADRFLRYISTRYRRDVHSRYHIADRLLRMNDRPSYGDRRLILFGDVLPLSVVKDLLTLARPLIGVHLSGSKQIRRLRPSVLRGVISRLPGTIVLLGSGEDQALAEEVLSGLGNVVSLVGRLSITETYGLIEGLDLCIAPDSLIMHMASAARVPLVAIMGNETIGLYGPYNGSIKTTVLHRNAKCSPCTRSSCTLYSGYSCVQDISEAEIVEAANALLESKGLK